MAELVEQVLQVLIQEPLLPMQAVVVAVANLEQQELAVQAVVEMAHEITEAVQLVLQTSAAAVEVELMTLAQLVVQAVQVL
jgi:hypothetical protein